jgi:hypothetical protein
MGDATCSVDECSSKVLAKEMCRKHYDRVRKHGDPNVAYPLRAITDPAERYSSHVQRNGPVPNHGRHLGRCHPWTSTLAESGYGVMTVGRTSDGTARLVLAHRFGWELAFGPIPPGKSVCHTCDNPPCQNPKHWFLGTQGDNMDDCARKGRSGGIGHTGQRLSDEDVRAIRVAYRTPHYGLRKELAEKYDVSCNYISALASRTKRPDA